MQTFALNRGTVGWFASTAPLTIALVGVPIGIIGTRFSSKKAFAVGAFLLAGGILAPFCTNYISLLFTRVLYALGTAITFTFATSIAAEWFSSRELPVATGITMSLNNIGNAFAFVATVPIAVAYSWRAPMMLYAGVALAGALAWTLFARDRHLERDKTLPGVAQLQPGVDLTIRQILTRRSTVLLGLATLGCWCLGNAMGSWLPSYYHEVFKMPLEKSSSITAVITGTGTFACLLGGFLPLKVGRRKPFLIIPGIFIGLSAISAVLFNNQVVIYLSVAAFGFFGNLQSASLFTIPFEIHKTSHRNGTIVIFVMLVVGNIGNFIGPLVVGYLADLTGSYLPGFIICALVSLSLLAAGLLLPETGPRARKPSPSLPSPSNL
jgi:MFS family permease